MECAVFDTYVTKKEGGVMHFDIIVPVNTEEEQVHDFGKEYLNVKHQEGQKLTANECAFCHIEKAMPHVEIAIQNKGYFILEMEGC